MRNEGLLFFVSFSFVCKILFSALRSSFSEGSASNRSSYRSLQFRLSFFTPIFIVSSTV